MKNTMDNHSDYFKPVWKISNNNNLKLNKMNKDKVTNICGLIMAIGGSIIALATGGIAIPAIVVTIATVSTGVSGGIIGYFTGKPNN